MAPQAGFSDCSSFSSRKAFSVEPIARANSSGYDPASVDLDAGHH
jgi:hypothetical protein